VGEPKTWTIWIPGRPVTQNSIYSRPRWTRSDAVAQVRKDAAILWRLSGIPRPLDGPLSIEAFPVYRNLASWPDTGACFPAVKAAIDSLVDIGVIPDDDPVNVVRLSMAAPQLAGKGPGLTVTATLETPCPTPQP
jgi:hypothetical protein